jgi:hypothetical protein
MVVKAGKEGYSALFTVMIQILLSITSVAVQNCLGIVIKLTVLERSGFITYYKFVLGAGAKAKTVMNLLILLFVLN